MRNTVLTSIICASTIAVFCAACNPRTTGENETRVSDVKLTVSLTTEKQPTSYGDTVASDGSIYSCNFGGGTENFGNWTFDRNKPVFFNLILIGDPTFSIDDVGFISDRGGQLGHDPVNGAPRNTRIHNKTSVAQTAYYVVIVKHQPTGKSAVTFLCDPKIINR